MPLDAMGGFEVFCRFLPFYPSIYLGRIITGAAHTPTDFASGLHPKLYAFDDVGIISLVMLAVYLVFSIAFAIFAFGRTMKKDD